MKQRKTLHMQIGGRLANSLSGAAVMGRAR